MSKVNSDLRKDVQEIIINTRESAYSYMGITEKDTEKLIEIDKELIRVKERVLDVILSYNEENFIGIVDQYEITEGVSVVTESGVEEIKKLIEKQNNNEVEITGEIALIGKLSGLKSEIYSKYI